MITLLGQLRMPEAITSCVKKHLLEERSDDQLPPPVKLVRQSFLAQPLRQDQLAAVITNSLRNASLGSESESHRKKRTCVKCGATSNKEGGRLHQCSHCHIANYCLRECQVVVRCRFQHSTDWSSLLCINIGLEKSQRVLQDHQE
jgi:hypothetical protein